MSQIRIAGKEIQYQIRRSHRAKHIRLSLHPNDGLIIVLPKGIRQININDLVKGHQKWILRRLKEQEKITPPFQIKNGASLPLLDEQIRLTINKVNAKLGHYRCQDHTLTLNVPVETIDWIYPGIKAWYKQEAKNYLQNWVPFWAQQMQVKPNMIRVKNQRTVWGSCSQKRNLNFNWRVMLLSVDEAEYLIIHELAHLQHLNHSKQFWRFVEKYCPYYQDLKKQIKAKSHWLRAFADW